MGLGTKFRDAGREIGPGACNAQKGVCSNVFPKIKKQNKYVFKISAKTQKTTKT